MADSPRSSLRMRMASSTGLMKIFAVADVAGAGGAEDGLDDLVLEGVGDDDLELDLGEKIDGVLAAAIELGVALLAAVAAGFQNGDSFDAGFDQGFFDGVQLGGLDDGFDLEHVRIPRLVT